MNEADETGQRLEKAYQIAIVYGDVAVGDAESIAEHVVVLSDRMPVTDAFVQAGVSPADLKARACFIPNAPVGLAIAGYAGVYGYAGRHVEVLTGGNVVIHTENIARSASATVTRREIEQRDEILQINGDNDHIPAVSLAFGNPVRGLNEADSARIRFAHRVRFVPTGGMEEAFKQLACICGLRRKRTQERFPQLAFGGETADADVIDLDAIRSAAAELRRETKEIDTAAVIAPREISDRARTLVRASNIDMPVLLSRLGCERNDDLFQCPRPVGHNHGDVSASMRVADNLARCYVHDPEGIDPLRLMMEVARCTPDEAAELLLSDIDAVGDIRSRIARERAELSGA